MGRDARSLTRATHSVSLVLLSSALLLAGCQRQEDKDKDKDQDQAATGTSHGGGGHFTHFGSGSRPVGSSFSSGTASAGATVRGGFGATGHAASAGS